jgi:hypothetical protein
MADELRLRLGSKITHCAMARMKNNKDSRAWPITAWISVGKQHWRVNKLSQFYHTTRVTYVPSRQFELSKWDPRFNAKEERLSEYNDSKQQQKQQQQQMQ